MELIMIKELNGVKEIKYGDEKLLCYHLICAFAMCVRTLQKISTIATRNQQNYPAERSK